MPTFTKHAPGTFSWVELATTDGEAAKKFYGALLGWTFKDNPISDGFVYSMAQSGEHTAAALFKMGPDMPGVPPNWLSYVTVADADATAKKAVAAGGKVMKEPFDVMTFGRMAVVTDPSGAAIAIWQAKDHIGAQVKSEPGAFSWNELYTTNVDAAGKFYIQTFGWQTEVMQMGPMAYTLFRPEGAEKSDHGAGMLPMPPDMKGVPSNWVVYFATADVDASTKKANDLGGSIIMPPMDIPNVGRFSIVKDPQGAAFALWKSAR